MKKIIIIGASGFGKEAAWIMERMSQSSHEQLGLLGFCDDALDKQEGLFVGVPLLGSVEAAASRLAGARFFCAIGNNHARQSVTARAVAVGLIPFTLVDPTAIIAPGVKIGEGSFIGVNSIISAGSTIGNHVIVSHQACIGHDVSLSDFVQVCPGARISGGCEIGEGALLGTNASTIPLVQIGAWATLGAGTTALASLPPHTTHARLK
jgi:sugar O-acyltransferase (sialic acid O-acetyltransferase NeuD family)